ncbi:MAG: hypothetical protein ACFFE2_09190 [Candidatus Thorarchaeota archaeon]
MIEVLLYGDVKMLVRKSIPDANSIFLFDYIEGEHLQDLLDRLGLKPDDVGACYINNNLAAPGNLIRDKDTIELNQPQKSVYE